MTPPKKPSPPLQSSSSATPPPGPSSPPGLPDRARAEDPSQRSRRDPLPLLYLLGFVILGGTLAYLYSHPTTPPEAQQAVVRVDGLQGQVQALTDRLAQVEARPAGAGAAAAADLALLDKRTAAVENRPTLAPADLKPLEDRIAALEGKPPPPPFDPAPLTQRLGALDALAAKGTADTGALGGRLDALASKQAADATAMGGRLDSVAAKEAADANAMGGRVDSLASKQAADINATGGRVDSLASKEAADANASSGRFDTLTAKETADVTAMNGRLDSAIAKQGADVATLGGRLDALDGRIGAVDQQAKQTASQIGTVAERSGRVVRMQAALAALASGQPLGDIPDAPPAVARFATTPAKTEQELRRSFDASADAAEQAGQPAIMESRSFGERLIARAQQAVTVRQGDRVLVGDPLSGRIIRARAALDAGDLAGAVKALDGLAGPAQAAMADWVGQARALLDARAALSSMAAHS